MHPRESSSTKSTRAQRLLLVDGFQDEADMYSEFFAHMQPPETQDVIASLYCQPRLRSFSTKSKLPSAARGVSYTHGQAGERHERMMPDGDHVIAIACPRSRWT
jgi:hypothetical protein